MNNKISSKYLNFHALSAITNSTDQNYEYDGVLLLTPYGTIIGKLKIESDNPQEPLLVEVISKLKQKFIDTFNESSESKLELVNDGSVITIKDAIVKGSNNTTINISEISIFSDQVVGFMAVNLKNILNQYT